MGGYNSGRTSPHPTIERTDCYVLPVNVLKTVQREIGGRWEAGSAWRGSMIFREGFELEWLVKVSAGHLAFDFGHPRRDGQEGDTIYPVQAVATPMRFGGVRWWWLCPRTNRRVTKLYLPLGGRRFLSRDGYGLGYASQRVTPADRRAMRARKLHRDLGGDGQAIGQSRRLAPPKPKGMRWRTYDRKVAAWIAADQAAEAAWGGAVLVRLGRMGFKIA